MEHLLRNLPLHTDNEKILTDYFSNEDAFVLAPPKAGMALVQSVDILAPIGNNPRLFGQCAAANAFSDIYAMGGEAYSAMNILSFAACDFPIEVIQEILLGALDKIIEANAVLAGGHTMEDANLKFGLSVTGIVNPNHFSRNCGLKVGDQLLLTKKIGTGILSTAIKAKWDNYEQAEENLYKSVTKLNKNASTIIQKFKLEAATDITGFGLGGHAYEMAKASDKSIIFYSENIPFFENTIEYAKNGLIPSASYANFNYVQQFLTINSQVDNLIAKLIFDSQTSGGLLLAVPHAKFNDAKQALADLGEEFYHVGEVKNMDNLNEYLSII